MKPRAFFFDLDGTLYQGGSAIPGAVELIKRLRADGIPCRFLSNTTSRPLSRIAARMRSYGFAIEDSEVLNATRAGGIWLDAQGIKRVAAFVPEESKADLGNVEHGGGGPVEAVVIGDMAGGWTDAHLQEAFTHLMAGAELVALSRDRYWHDGTRLVMDCGGYVAALEHATGKRSHVVGKPSEAFFHSALASLGEDIPASEVVMVGDDIETDVGGAQRAGFQGWLVKTGKYDAERVADSGVRPDRILESVGVLGSPTLGSVVVSYGMTTPPPEPPADDAESSAPASEAAASSSPPPSPPPSVTPKKRRWKLKLTLLAILLVPLLFLVLYTVIMLNYAYSSGTKAGYLQLIESRGWFCKTDEGELLITSAPGVPTETWAFSVRDDSIAQELLSRVGQRVVVRYEEHRGLPTRCFGATSFFVDSIL